jgi:hypothetical protein
MLLSYGAGDLQIESDDGHRFVFRVVREQSSRKIAIDDVSWSSQRQPADISDVLAHASRFASACARDFGLM